jgi:hypothetical protein
MTKLSGQAMRKLAGLHAGYLVAATKLVEGGFGS